MNISYDKVSCQQEIYPLKLNESFQVTDKSKTNVSAKLMTISPQKKASDPKPGDQLSPLRGVNNYFLLYQTEEC